MKGGGCCLATQRLGRNLPRLLADFLADFLALSATNLDITFGFMVLGLECWAACLGLASHRGVQCFLLVNRLISCLVGIDREWVPKRCSRWAARCRVRSKGQRTESSFLLASHVELWTAQSSRGFGFRQ